MMKNFISKKSNESDNNKSPMEEQLDKYKHDADM